MSETSELSFTERIQQELNAKNQAPETIVPAVPVEPVAPAAPATPAEPAAPVTPVAPVESAAPVAPAEPAKKPDFLAVLKNPELAQEDPAEKAFREKFEKQYEQDLKLAQLVKTDKFASDYAKYKNDPDFDPRKFFTVNTTDYSSYSPAQMYIESLKNKGITFQGEDLEKEVEGFEQKLSTMLSGEKKAYINGLKESMPKPEDPMARWNDFVTEKEKRDAAYIAEMDNTAKELSTYATTIAGVQFGGVEISSEKVRNILSETYEEWNSGYYNPKAKEILTDRVLAAHIKENWTQIVSNIKTDAEIEFLAKRTNATPGASTTAPSQSGLTEAQQAQINIIKGIHHGNPERIEMELKKAGLPIN